MAEQPPGSSAPPVIKEQHQQPRRFSNDKIKNFTKIQIQDYIESFFKREGCNFDLLKAVSPRFIHYNTDKSFDPATDPTERRMQIARYFAELKNVLPSILVVDGGIIGVPHNIGLLGGATLCGGIWRATYPIFRRVPIAIVAAARDVDEADEISGVLSLMFNELRNLAEGHYLAGKREDYEKWVITLPNAPVEVGALTDADVPGDPIQKIWYTETILDVFYEDSLDIKQEMEPVVYNEGGGRVGEGDLTGTGGFAPVIEIPDVLSINEQYQIVIRNWQDHYRVVLSSARVATITLGLLLTPRSFGKVTIQVVDPNRDGKVVSEVEVEVT